MQGREIRGIEPRELELVFVVFSSPVLLLVWLKKGFKTVFSLVVEWVFWLRRRLSLAMGKNGELRN